jgi:hypothetical protein
LYLGNVMIIVKFILLSLAGNLLIACSKHTSSNYYRANPHALIAAIKACHLAPTMTSECAKLQIIAGKANQLAYRLQSNPQAFGRKIIALQEKLASLNAQLITHPKQSEIKQAIVHCQQQLDNYLAIVKWLESPQ